MCGGAVEEVIRPTRRSRDRINRSNLHTTMVRMLAPVMEYRKYRLKDRESVLTGREKLGMCDVWRKVEGIHPTMCTL